MGDKPDLYFLCSLNEKKLSKIKFKIKKTNKFNIIEQNEENEENEENEKKEMKELIEKIKQKKFKQSCVIVDEKKMNDLFQILKEECEKELYGYLKIYIFCLKKKNSNYLMNHKPYYEYPFFTKDFVFNSIKSLTSFLEDEKSNNNKIFFDKVKDEKDYRLLDFYDLLSEPSTEEIQKFQNDLRSDDQNIDSQIKQLLEQSDGIELKNIKGIVAKYWLKFYEKSDKFANEMNLKLQENLGSCYDVYIRLLYYALKKKYITPFIPSDQILYKRIKITKKEIKQFKQSNFFYIRSFMIFNSKDMNEKETNILLMIEKNADSIVDEETSTSVSLKKFKENEDENENGNEEILFFPFSIFKAAEPIKKIGNQEQYQLKLTYIGNYSNKKEEDENKDLGNYKKDIVRGCITSDQKITEYYPELLKLKREIKGVFKTKKNKEIILLNPDQDSIKDCVKIHLDSSQNPNDSDIKLSVKQKFTEEKQCNINFSFSDGLDDCIFLFKSSEAISLDLLNFDMENIKSFHKMFCDCTNLTTIKFPNVKLLKIDDLSGMFFNCYCLKSVNLENFIQTKQKIRNMDYMFYKCKALKNINFQNLKTKTNCTFNNTFYKVNKKCKVEVIDLEIKKQWYNYLNEEKKCCC